MSEKLIPDDLACLLADIETISVIQSMREGVASIDANATDLAMIQFGMAADYLEHNHPQVWARLLGDSDAKALLVDEICALTDLARERRHTFGAPDGNELRSRWADLAEKYNLTPPEQGDTTS